MKLVWVALICAAPIVLGTAAYFFGWGTGAGGNYGELIPPRPLGAQALAPLRGKWVLVAFDTAACDAYCERKLYLMRQVRRAQGKEMERVERMWGLMDAGKPRPELLPGIEGTWVTQLSPQEFPGDPRDYLYLVDPLGNLMLRFPRDPDPSKMIKDLQRLLKYSPRYG